MKRVKGFRMLFMLLLFLLVGRLYYIQVLCNSELAETAWGQQRVPLLREESKGEIYDRNMNVLTGCEKAYFYLIHKDNLKAGTVTLLQQIHAEPAGKRGEEYLIFRTNTFSTHISSQLQEKWNAYGFCINARCGETQAAGYLIADLDEMYGDLLTSSTPAFCFQGNGAGDLIRGTGMIKEGITGSSGKEATALMTTLDRELQQSVETLMEDENVTGSAVVADTATGHILAMASRSGKTDANGSEPNLALEQDYRLGSVYDLVKETADVFDMKTKEIAEMLGLGKKVFDSYPEEAEGKVTAGRKTTATTTQMSRILVRLANEGNQVPLTLLMSTAKEQSIPCMELTADAAVKLRKLREDVTQKPFTGDGWALGCHKNYAVAIHLEKGNPRKIYHLVVEHL